jgi:GR25 family glycosyltransferase involved in LPS biosynthesis
MRTGVIGCALSHMKLYKQLIDEQHVDGYVIIEDDIVVPDDFVSKMNRVFSIIENRYIHPDVVFFTIIPKNDINQQPKGLIRQTYEEIKNISIGGTGCYYVSKKGARNILDRIDKLTLECAIDAVLYRMSDDYDIYYTFPPIASQVNDPISNVQDDFNYTSPLYEDNIQDSYFSTHVVYNDKGEIDLFDDLKV